MGWLDPWWRDTFDFLASLATVAALAISVIAILRAFKTEREASRRLLRDRERQFQIEILSRMLDDSLTTDRDSDHVAMIPRMQARLLVLPAELRHHLDGVSQYYDPTGRERLRKPGSATVSSSPGYKRNSPTVVHSVRRELVDAIRMLMIAGDTLPPSGLDYHRPASPEGYRIAQAKQDAEDSYWDIS